VKCIYYGDCPFTTAECQDDEPHYICKHREIVISAKGYFSLYKEAHIDLEDDGAIGFRTEGETSERLNPDEAKQFFLAMRNQYLANNDKFWRK
jgi:hypothetical protein